MTTCASSIRTSATQFSPHRMVLTHAAISQLSLIVSASMHNLAVGDTMSQTPMVASAVSIQRMLRDALLFGLVCGAASITGCREAAPEPRKTTLTFATGRRGFSAERLGKQLIDAVRRSVPGPRSGRPSRSRRLSGQRSESASRNCRHRIRSGRYRVCDLQEIVGGLSFTTSRDGRAARQCPSADRSQ